MTPELFAAAARICRGFVPPGGYGLVYGSQATGPADSQSDLDLVLVGRDRPGPRMMRDLVAAVCRLHDEFGLHADSEVAYETKLFATYRDTDCAVELRCFPRRDGLLCPESVVPEPFWLNSSEFAQRLLLNALTSEHVFLGGNVRRYRADRSRAEQALAVLVMSMLAPRELTVSEAVQVLTRAPDGVEGKDFLGYVPSAHLCSTIQSGLASLIDRNIVEAVDGVRFRRCNIPRERSGPGETSSSTCDNGTSIPIERNPR
ncbi:hypothetical protein ACIGO9_09710 [Nocardia asteroides]|uniref:hypothetical protein n=1 Tax=Nocardia asteroides TaxID=1824 RepID=UPI0037C55E08